MSQENVEAFKRGIEAYSRRDVEALLTARLIFKQDAWLPVP